MEGIVKECFEIAKRLEVFKEEELKILSEVLEACSKSKDYMLLYEKAGDKIAGFIILGRTPLTEFCWDIYWLAVDKEFQEKGIGKRLIKRAEDYILSNTKRAIIRIETSSLKQYAHARGLYKRAGFNEAGRIANFYSLGDDLIIFSKEITKND